LAKAVSQSLVIIDYGSGNLRSAAKAFERSARERKLSCHVQVSDKADDVHKADRIVLPGVGAFADCKKGLLALDGMVEALKDAVIQKGKPFFGICVGMQLMASEGLEHGITDGLGWIKGQVGPLSPLDKVLKIPHMGWNTIQVTSAHPLLRPWQGKKPYAYFVHSYHFQPAHPADCLAVADYGGAVSACIGRDNLFGTQFHPEKSQQFGLDLIGQFLEWTP
jgi:glutamine amidotransferase